MRKLVLIGNGFDLAHGLKTRYSDFILWYLNNVHKALINTGEYSDELLSATTEYGFGNNPKKTFESINEFYKFYSIDKKWFNVNSKIRFSFKYAYFGELLKKIGDFKWVDIEYDYYMHLLVIYNAKERLNQKKIEVEIGNLNICFDLIKEKLQIYLTMIDKASKSLNFEIDSHFKEINVLGNPPKINDFLILNFNYTSTIEKYIPPYNHKNIIYIHGKLNDENNPIIFGYGDEMDKHYQGIEDLNSNEFLRNFKSFAYLRTLNYQKITRFIGLNLFEVLIMGHSCGISDRVLLNSIVEKPDCSKIRIYYHDKGNGENDYFEKTQELSRHFKLESKGEMRNKIVPFPESTPLVPAR